MKWWPMIVIGMIVLYGVMMVPAVGKAVMQYDRAAAITMNSYVGASPLLDNFVVAINTDVGDRTVFLFFAALFLIHSLWRPTRRDVAQRLAFWTWVTIMFAGAYLLQEAAEELFSRDSPGKVIPGWIDMGEIYDRDIKVRSGNSFPSGHATAYWFCAFMALPVYRRVGATLLAVSVVVPTLRVMTGAHWVSDIWLGSAPLSFIVAVLSYETRLCKIRDGFAWLYFWAISLFLDRAHAPLSRRFAASYQAFMNPDGVAVESKREDEAA